VRFVTLRFAIIHLLYISILASASICPIVAVLALGVYVQWRVKKDNERATEEASEDVVKA
jgi:hypothetical protein